MQCVGARLARDIDDFRDVEIRLARVAAAEGNRLVEETADEADVVRLGVREDGGDAHLAAAARDADRDFAAVRDDQFVHGAFSFFKNACSSDLPSSDTRRAAIASIVYGIASAASFDDTNVISFLHSRTASGPEVLSCFTVSATAASRSSVTRCTSPIRSARSASKRSPVRNNARACVVPIFAITYGELTAGRMPSFTSDKPNFTSGFAITMSHTGTSPTPPPIAAPCTAPISGTGHSFISANIFASSDESWMFWSRVYETIFDIQLRSARAQRFAPVS